MTSNPSSTPGAAWNCLVLPFLFAAMMVVLQCRPIHDVDIFWQLKAGEITIANGALPEKEPFSATHANEPFVPLYGYSQVLFALVYRWGGWSALHFFDSLIWSGGFLLVFISTNRRCQSTGAALIATALAFVVALPFNSIRPQSFSILAFAAIIAVLQSSWSHFAKLALLAIVLVIWQNLHPSASIAVIASVAAATFGWVNVWRSRTTAKPWIDTILIALAGAACFATRMGYEQFSIAAFNAEMSRDMAVGEWLPLWNDANRANSYTVWLGLAVTVFLLIRRGRNARAEDWGRGAVLAILTVLVFRFASYWAVAMIPVWAETLAEKDPNASSVPRTASARLGYQFVAWLLSILIAIALPGLIRPHRFAEYLPLEGVDRLKSTGIEGTIVCHPAWAGPLINAGSPQWRVSFDGRYFVYTREEWNDYRRAATGELSLSEIVKRYHPAAFFLRPHAEQALIDELHADAKWTEIYSDHNCVAFVPRIAP